MSYASTSWSPEDIRTLAPRLSVEEAERWLQSKEGQITDRLTERGWDVISVLLAMDGIDTSDPDSSADNGDTGTEGDEKVAP